MRIRRSRARHKQVVELNITAFMNLMVVLVPFLLMTAVFTHISILELNLPSLGDAKQDKKNKPSFELHVTIRDNAILLSDNRGGLIKRIAKVKSGHNYQKLRSTLKQIKARFPDKTNATILSEQDTKYRDLVATMDAVRQYPALVDGEIVLAELFPDISIGDAPGRGRR
ncbi:MAG: biopolymer transporter ExbD [Thioalkalispiraceae bacterium]|jgi:biopolymer transport protein ExbD